MRNFLLDAEPLCTAVRGCTRRAFTKSFPLNGRKVRICSMHRSRYMRTGRLGPAATIFELRSGSDHPGRQNARLALLRRLRRRLGEEWIVLPKGRALFRVFPGKGKQRAAPIAVSALCALERRGWIERGERLPGGAFRVAITVAGAEAVR